MVGPNLRRQKKKRKKNEAKGEKKTRKGGIEEERLSREKILGWLNQPEVERATRSKEKKAKENEIREGNPQKAQEKKKDT